MNPEKDEPKSEKSMMSEAPRIVRLLSDLFTNRQRSPLVRLGAIAVAALVLLYPFWVKSHRAPRKTGDRVVNQMGTATTMLPDDDTGKTSKETAERPAHPAGKATHDAAGAPAPESDSMQGSATQPAVSGPLFTAFTQIKGVPQIVIDDPAGTTWIGTTREVIEARQGKLEQAISRLNPQVYESLFNMELPVLSAFTLDSRGRLWVGSKTGSLLIYDNHDWRVLWEPHDPMKTAITAIKPLSGSVYVGGTGLWRWAEDTGTLSRVVAFKDVQVQSLEQAESSMVLAGEHSVWGLTPQGWVQRYAGDASRETIATVQMSSQGYLLIGSNLGLHLLAPGQAAPQHLLQKIDVRRIAADREGNIWIGTADAGLLLFRDGGWYQLQQVALPLREILYLAVDQQDRLWAGGVAGELLYAPRRSVIQAMLAHPYTPPVVDLSAPILYKTACRAATQELRSGERSGDIALVSIEGTPTVFFRGRQICPDGLGSLRPDGKFFRLVGDSFVSGEGVQAKKLNVPYDKADPNRPKYRSLLYDSKDRLWLGHSLGLAVAINGTWNNYDENPDFKGVPVESLSEDATGTVWAGAAPVYPTPKAGEPPAVQSYLPCLFLFHGDEVAKLSAKDGLPGWYVSDLLPLKNGSMAVATNRGTALVSEKGITRLAPVSTASQLPVVSLSQDTTGRIWQSHSLYSGGVSWVENGELGVSSDHVKLFSDRLIGIYHDAKGRVWIEASNGEIGIYDRSVFDAPLVAAAPSAAAGTDPVAAAPADSPAARPAAEPDADEDE